MVAKQGLSIARELLAAAGEDPNVQKAGSNLGQSALTVTKAINNALLPLAAINFAFDKARQYFATRFEQDISSVVSGIPSEHVVEPRPAVAGPALQGLAFTHEEPNLRDMYLNLIATAMDGRVSESAHPAFVEIIKQLDPAEADLLRLVIDKPTPLPIVQVQRSTTNGGYHVLLSHLINSRGENDNPVVLRRLPAMVDNWVRLGLVEVSYDRHLVGDLQYQWVEKRPEFLALREQHRPDPPQLSYEKGIMQSTALGQQFAEAVGLVNVRAPQPAVATASTPDDSGR